MKGYLVGYGRADMTPQQPIPLMGYGNTIRRVSGPVLDPLYATCVAITDAEGNSMLMIGSDSTVPNYVGYVREEVSQALGIPMEHVLVNVTHTHSAPDLDANHPGVAPYRELYKKAHVEAALAAFADRKPAKMFYGSVETEGLNFVRHYRMDDGSFGGDNFGDWTNHYAVDNVTEVDPTMHLLKFEREGGKDVLVMNWRAHASITGGSLKPDVSADFVGSVRMYLEKELDCHFAYWQGCAGNVNPRSRIPERDCTRDYMEFGRQLGAFAQKALENMEEQTPGRIRVIQYILPGQINHTKDHLVEKAKEIRDYWTETGDWTGAKNMGMPHGIRSPFQALGIIKRSTMGQTFNISMSAVALNDDVAFATSANELFDTTGQYVEDHSPFRHTMVLGYTNGQTGYMPSAYAWYYTCYESDCTRFAPGVAEEIAWQQLRLLREIK